MDNFDIDYALEHMTLLVDTREKPTFRFRNRMKTIGIPYERFKLDFGDYSVKCKISNGGEVDFSSAFAIERKMSLDEICSCFCGERSRFTKEFERAQECGGKIYLLIEDGSWEKVLAGEYRSKMHSSEFLASLTAWLARYNCQIIFCEPKTTGTLIKEILYREAKERLAKIG